MQLLVKFTISIQEKNIYRITVQTQLIYA